MKENYFDKILHKHCPKEIPRKAIGDFAIVFHDGRLLERHIIPKGDTPCLIQKDLATMKGNSFNSCKNRVNQELVANKRYFEKENILFSRMGDSMKEVGKVFLYEGDEFALAGNNISILKHNQNPKFLVRVLSSEEVRQQIIHKTYKRGGFLIEHEDLKTIKVPLPPIDIQNSVMKEVDDKEREGENRGIFARFVNLMSDIFLFSSK